MPGHHHGPGRRRRAADDADQPGRGRVINVVIKYHRYRSPERDRGELPCLTSPAGCRAQNLVRNAARIPEPPPHGGSIPVTSAGKRPVMMWRPGPGRLGMPDQHQPPALPTCHDHSVPGPIRQVPALQNAVPRAARKPGTRPLSCAAVGWERRRTVVVAASASISRPYPASRTRAGTAALRRDPAIPSTLAACLVVESVTDLASQHRPEQSMAGMAVMAAALVVMPLVAVAKRSLRPGSACVRRWSLMASRWVVWPCAEDGHRS